MRRDWQLSDFAIYLVFIQQFQINHLPCQATHPNITIDLKKNGQFMLVFIQHFIQHSTIIHTILIQDLYSIHVMLFVVVVYPLPPCIIGAGVHLPALLKTTDTVHQGGQQGCHSNGISPQIHRRQWCVYVCEVEHLAGVCFHFTEGTVC